MARRSRSADWIVLFGVSRHCRFGHIHIFMRQTCQTSGEEAEKSAGRCKTFCLCIYKIHFVRRANGRVCVRVCVCVYVCWAPINSSRRPLSQPHPLPQRTSTKSFWSKPKKKIKHKSVGQNNDCQINWEWRGARIEFLLFSGNSFNLGIIS